MKIKNTLQSIYSIVFLLIFFVLLLGQVFVPDMHMDTLSENYLWRKTMINKFLLYKYEIGDRVFSTVLVGESGWLYYTYNLSMRNYQKVDPLNNSNIKKISTVLEQINDRVKQHGGELIVVVAPDKSTIYPQFMPEEIPVIGNEASLDRLIAYLEKSGEINLVDLRPNLLEASRTVDVYYKTDTHWNCEGAYVAYSSILSYIKSNSDLPEVHVYEKGDFKITYHNTYLDLAGTINYPVPEPFMTASPDFDVSISDLSGENGGRYGQNVRIKVNSNDSLPTSMVFHDSFYDACLVTYIETSFGHTISAKYADISLSNMLEMIEQENPEVVIVEFAERFMEYFMRQVDQ